MKNTHLIPLILYTCLIASVGVLGAGYILAGYWWMVPVFFLLAIFWGFTIKHPVLWISSSLLSTHVILAAIGIAAGISQLLMIASCICALASWDLAMFDQRMDRNVARNINASLEKRHLQSLGWATAIGLIKRDSISKWNPVAKTIIAQPSATYDKAHDLFHRLYEQTKDIATEFT